MTESLRVQEVEVSPPPEAGPGQRLSEARQAKNLTVAKVAQQMHLDPRLVVALEDNDYDHLPEPIYVTGYLRNYARLLGLPEEQIVGAYHQLDRPAPPILSELTRNAPRRSSFNQAMIQWGAVAVVGIGLVVFGWQMNGKQAPRAESDRVPHITPGPEATSRPAAPAAQLAAAVPGVSSTGKDRVAAGPDTGQKNSDAKPVPAVTPPVEKSPAAAAENTNTSLAAMNPAATVALHFLDDSWVEMTDATGERVFYDLGEAGETHTVQGTPPFKVLLGYSPGVSIEYNGVPFDQSRFTNRNNVARFTLGR